MDSQIIKKRLLKIRRLLSGQRLNCLLILKPSNVSFVTNFSGDDSWAIITAKKVYLLTDSRYTEQAQAECKICEIIERKGSIIEAAAQILNENKVKSFGIESTASVDILQSLQKKIKITIKPVKNIIEQVRIIKDESEIELIKQSADIAAKAFAKITKFVTPGITESELAGRLDLEIRLLGAKNSFETIVAFGANASRPHHQPGQRKLKKNDTILIDYGAKFKGYCSDITRCFTVGKSDEFYKKVYNIVKNAQLKAIKMVKAGIDIEKLDSVPRDIIAKNDLPVYGHGTGHGIGLEIHEGPTLTRKVEGKLKEGMVITIEPGVYIPNKLGVRIEDDVLVTKTGCKILTNNCPKRDYE